MSTTWRVPEPFHRAQAVQWKGRGQEAMFLTKSSLPGLFPALALLLRLPITLHRLVLVGDAPLRVDLASRASATKSKRPDAASPYPPLHGTRRLLDKSLRAHATVPEAWAPSPLPLAWQGPFDIRALQAASQCRRQASGKIPLAYDGAFAMQHPPSTIMMEFADTSTRPRPDEAAKPAQ